MRSRLKKRIKSWTRIVTSFVCKTKFGEYLEGLLIDSAMQKVVLVSHAGILLRFCGPNALCRWRYETFSAKEPETLEWIDSIPEDSVLWDIGANIGLYSVYAAKKSRCKVWAFEPSVFNLEVLARNIFLNNLGDSICIVPLAVSDKNGSSIMRMSSNEWGGALSTFGETFGWNGEAVKEVFQFKTVGLTMADAAKSLLIPMPDYIKIDVDGIEHLILKGSPEILKNIKGILIEVNDLFHQQRSQCQTLLSAAGLVLKEKCQSEMTSISTAGFQNSFNQIWVRP